VVKEDVSMSKEHKLSSKELDRKVRENLERIERAYGEVPFITTTIAERPELFLAYSELTRHVLFEPEHLDPKTLELAAIAAGAALGSERCLDVHLRQAGKHGVTDEEIFEAIMIGSVMAMSNSQASGLRRFKAYQEAKDKS
jgi:AhpD family alkylhydroperoxidase